MIAQAPFGRTGHHSSRVIFGAAGLGSASQEEADRVLPLLLDHGVNHLDTAADYGDAELRLAPWLAGGGRERFFLATKTSERTAAGARAGLERSLQRLGVDSVDLIQLHNLVEEDEWATAHGPGGAVEALVAARDEGLVRFIGVTGHGLRIAGMHLRSLERFDADTVLLPYNFSLLADPGYRADVEALLELCAARQVAVQTIKSVARRRWRDPADDRASWYEPLGDDGAIARSVRWVLARDQLFLICSSDYAVLPAVLDAAEHAGAAMGAPSDEEMAADQAALGIEPLFDGGVTERI